MEPNKSQSFSKQAQANFPISGIIGGNVKVGGSVRIKAQGTGSAGIVSQGLQVGQDVTHTLVRGESDTGMPVGSFVTGNEVIGGRKQVNIGIQQQSPTPASPTANLPQWAGSSELSSAHPQLNRNEFTCTGNGTSKPAAASGGYSSSDPRMMNSRESGWTPLPERIHKRGENYSITITGDDMRTNGPVNEEEQSSDCDDSTGRVPEKRNRFQNISSQSSGSSNSDNLGNGNSSNGFDAINASSTPKKPEEPKGHAFEDVFAKYQQFINSGATVGTFVGGNSTVGTEVHNSPHGTIPGTKMIGNVTLGSKKVGTLINNSTVPGYTTNFVGQNWETESETHFEETGTEAKPAIGKYKIGLVLMINNKFDTPLEDLPEYVQKENYVPWARKGAERDKDLIAETFLKLTGNRVGYIPNVRNSEALIAYLNKFKLAIKKTDPDYVIIIVSSHGLDHNHLLMDDLTTADLYEDILYQFGKDKFPVFTKPLILLVQACQRGPEFNENLYNSVTYKFKKLNISSKSGASTSISRDGPGGEFAQEDSSKEGEKVQFFIGLSTLPNKVAYRDHSQGSFYIQAVSSQFCKEETLAKLFRKVDDEVGRLCGEAGVKQATSIIKSPDFPEDFCF